jgi:hypothetical protein
MYRKKVKGSNSLKELRVMHERARGYDSDHPIVHGTISMETRINAEKKIPIEVKEKLATIRNRYLPQYEALSQAKDSLRKKVFNSRMSVLKEDIKKAIINAGLSLDYFKNLDRFFR